MTFPVLQLLTIATFFFLSLFSCKINNDAHQFLIDNSYVKCQLIIPSHYTYYELDFSHEIGQEYITGFFLEDSLAKARLYIKYYKPNPSKEFEVGDIYLRYGFPQNMDPCMTILGKYADYKKRVSNVDFMKPFNDSTLHLGKYYIINSVNGIINIQFGKEVKKDSLDYNKIIKELNELGNNIEFRILEIKAPLKELIKKYKTKN